MGELLKQFDGRGDHMKKDGAVLSLTQTQMRNRLAFRSGKSRQPSASPTSRPKNSRLPSSSRSPQRSRSSRRWGKQVQPSASRRKRQQVAGSSVVFIQRSPNGPNRSLSASSKRLRRVISAIRVSPRNTATFSPMGSPRDFSCASLITGRSDAPHQVELAISRLDLEEHRSPIDTFQHAGDLHRCPFAGAACVKRITGAL
jgi:hypothetical protein